MAKAGRLSKILLVDGTNALYRAFFAIPNLRAPDGSPTNAAYGFTAVLLKIIREKKPDGIIVAFDLPGPTFRHKEFEDYKATRKAMPEDLIPQIPCIKKILKAFGVQEFSLEGYEADDIIGTIAKKASREKLLTKALQEEAIYKELATAFGKKGIQAMLIETALPDIEDEANRLLGRMTDNRLHVRLETQRQSKKGDVIETLDIKIADELGTRSYEMFSGGEAFRIDFAIRIALSKLLAKRAGAPLPTLIIDEGFGTQDNAGLERLKEAINSIEGDFDKILVITHIEDLKDAFPVRIEVNKTAQGSTLSLS